jgi:hypothetical protein
MTALKEYDRLECTGLWRSGPAEQRREVAVSFGDATIVLTDMQNRALAHWSLAAINLQKHTGDTSILRPGSDSDESLEISDRVMLEALAKVHKAIERNRPHPGRLRLILALVIVIIIGMISAIWGPKAIISYASTVVPQVKRVQLGDALAQRIGQLAGPYCSSPEGNHTVQKLADRLNTDRTLRLLVLPGQRTLPITLPGGKVILFENMLTTSDDPAVTAGYILSALAAFDHQDPLRAYLEQAGPFTSLSLVASNNLSKTQVDQLAKIALSQPQTPSPQTALLNLFSTAKISSSPFARVKAGTEGQGLIAQDPFLAGSPYPVLTDGAWLSLQAICSDM